MSSDIVSLPPGVLGTVVIMVGLVVQAGIFLCGTKVEKHQFFSAGLLLLLFSPLIYFQVLMTGWLFRSLDDLGALAQSAIIIAALAVLPWTLVVLLYRTLVSIAAPHSLRTFAIPGLKLLLGLQLSDHDAEIVYSAADASGSQDSVSG